MPLRSARVDTSAIVHNLKLLQKTAGTEVLADVSADAYGHGAVPVAGALQAAGVRSFVVATVAQGAALRRCGIDATIVAWLHPAAESFRAAADHRITVAVSSPEQLSAAHAAGVAELHLAADVNGSAIGCPDEQWSALVDAAVLAEGRGLRITGIMGITPRRTPASRSDRELLHDDNVRFGRRVTAARQAGLDPYLTHLSGSAAAITGAVDRPDAARVGRALYGLSPFGGESAAELGLIGAMSITARVIGTKTVAAGEGISYGYTYRTTTRSNLALVAIGYAHGIDRYASNTGTARLNGTDYPIAGRVAMDVFVLDLGGDTAAVGDEVVLFGPPDNPTAEEWSEAIDRTGQQVVTCVTSRVPRIYTPAPLVPDRPSIVNETTSAAPGVATIDLDAYRHNIARLRSIVAPAELMVMIKGNAYGHGLLPIARAAIDEGITRIGVLETATGLALRRAGIGREVSLFAWLLAPDEDYRAAIDAGIELGISDVAQLRAIAGSGAHDRAQLHLKIDTGLHRNGVTEENWPGLVRDAVALQAAGKARLCAAWTHIAEASEAEDTAALHRFEEAIRVGERLGARFPLRHLAASAAGFARADCRLDLVRMGAFTFGISPGGGVTPTELGLVPVMTLSTQVTHIRHGRAIVPLGYAQGVPSGAPGVVPVTIDGIRHPVAVVEQNYTVIDVGGSAEVRVGDRVVIFGRAERGEMTLQVWADALGTIGEELVVRVGAEVPRSYLG
ncbi:alanine racemase [Parafrigoribacterium mesophilum]|uniref:alanine racemase n=1 Tax=Parafrigoribacterium mesophilum TaxID=433646 RepID=UPI0031FCF5AA